jgi:hypothetical protein
LLSDASAIGSKGKLSGKFSKKVNVIPMLSLFIGTIMSYNGYDAHRGNHIVDERRKYNDRFFECL